MVIVKKGEELKLNLFNNEKERNNKDKTEEELENKKTEKDKKKKNLFISKRTFHLNDNKYNKEITKT